MALFVDGPGCGIEDLTDQDCGLLEVSESNGINVTTKVRLAQDEIATDLQLWLAKSRLVSLRLEQVVVTPVLRRWLVMRTLELVYRDAYYSQLVDRFQSKWQEFARLARDTRESYVAGGMAIVTDPLPRPGPPSLTTATAPQTGGTFYASVAWVNSRGQESAVSAASSLAVQNGHVMLVTPTGAPSNATGYRVYAGTSLEAMTLQNPVALAPRTTYQHLPGHATDGPLGGSGQVPDYIRPMTRVIPRG